MKNSSLPSQKQQALLNYIDAFIKENNYAPSYREVMAALEYKSVSTVAKHIDGLIGRGWLVKRDNSARSVEVVYRASGGGQDDPQKSPAPSLSSVPEALLEAVRNRLRIPDPAKFAGSVADATLLVDALKVLGYAEAETRARAEIAERLADYEAD